MGLEEYKRADEARRKRIHPSQVDFRNPTPEQLADAEAHGIDLHDPLVVEELERLQRERTHETPMEERELDEIDCEQRQRAPQVRHRSKRPPPPDVSKIPLHEIRRRLDDMGVTYDDCLNSRPALEQKLLAQYQPGSGGSFVAEPDELYSDDEEDVGYGLFSWLPAYCTIL